MSTQEEVVRTQTVQVEKLESELEDVKVEQEKLKKALLEARNEAEKRKVSYEGWKKAVPESVERSS